MVMGDGEFGNIDDSRLYVAAVYHSCRLQRYPILR